jgi:hypothetical protein
MMRVCCSVRCRQARHRFSRPVGYADSVAPGRPLRLAYADPPYPGKVRLYRDHPDYGGEVDHAASQCKSSGTVASRSHGGYGRFYLGRG